MSSGVILLQRPYISFSSPLLLILRREITAATVALFIYVCGSETTETWIYMVEYCGMVITDQLH